MGILGPNFRQNIDPGKLASLPKLAMYEGDERSLAEFKDRYIRTEEVEKVIPVGERENVWVEAANGDRWRPWMGVAIYEVDADDKPVYNHTPLPDDAGKGMSIGELSKQGLSDQDLIDMAKDLLGETYKPDRPGPSLKRQEVYDRVMKAAYG